MDAADQPSRSAATRARILRAARARFAATGYERATIRAIAADAAIDPSMVMRYYGSKAGLFAAASEPDLRLGDLTAVPRADLGRRLVEHFLARWETPADGALLALLRAAATDDGAAARLRTMFADQLVGALAEVVEDRAAERAGLVATQMLGLALCRQVLRLPPVVAMAPEAVADRLAPTIQRYLDDPL